MGRANVGKGAQMRGPLDYIIVKFPGKKFDGGILRELSKAIESGDIIVLDIALVARNEYGDTHTFELTDSVIRDSLHVDPANRKRIITDEDTRQVGELLENGAMAGFLIIEQLWAKGLKEAIISAGGTLLNDGLIHPDVTEQPQIS